MLTIILAALITVTTGAASIMSGCGDSEISDTSATKTVTETEIVTRIVEYTETVTDSNGNTVNAADSNSSGGSSSAGSGSASGPASGSNSSNGGSSSGDSSGAAPNGGNSASVSKSSSAANSSGSSNASSGGSSASSENSAGNNSDSSKTLSVAGNKYSVGDTVVCELKITSPTVLENFEGTLRYNHKYLKLKTAHLEGSASSSGIINYKNQTDKINFNGSNISKGFDYTGGGTLVYAEFEVVASGSTKPSVTWEAATQLKTSNGTQYIKDGKPVNGFKASLVYS